LAGIILGPTVFGALLPGTQTALFPSAGPVALAFHGLTTLAITMYLMVAGMEVDLSTVWRQGRAALIVGFAGILLPFALGFSAAWMAPAGLGSAPDADRVAFALFLATAMAITALPVIAKILLDLNLFRTDVGTTIVAAAILNDLLGWIIFALVLAMMGGQPGGLPVWQIAVITLLFAIFMLTVARWAVNRCLPWVQAHTSWPGGVLGFGLTLTLLSAAFTEAIGVHAIFGGFLFGIVLGDSPHLRQRTRTTIDNFVSFIFAPLFFASIGLRVDFVQHFDLMLTVVILVIASVGKILGCTVAARWAGFQPKEARAVGIGMNARGAMEIILGILALEVGIIGPRLFVALVLMALITSLSSAVLIQRIFETKRAARFVNYVLPKTFVTRFHPNDRYDAVATLTRLAAEAAGIDAEAAIRAVWVREQLVSNALGKGIAVPHARIADLKQPVVAVGLGKSDIDYDPPDGVPVSVVILILTPADAPELHVSLLADIARTFHGDHVAQTLADEVTNLTEFRAALNVEAARRPHF
jgi:Kef-type K+ transport system membrane component KefB/mannitol/fructose-specific phosphotransferase system IIA component